MRRTLIFSLLFVLFSCSFKTIPLKNKYQSETFYQNTATPFDKVWDKLVDLFAKKGLSIKVIDHTSGLIISDRYKLTFTNEDKNGKLENPDAYIVLPKVYLPGSTTNIIPTEVVGEWNVRIKDDGKGGTLINVNLVNIKEITYTFKVGNTEKNSSGVSTGVFEKFIFETIK